MTKKKENTDVAKQDITESTKVFLEKNKAQLSKLLPTHIKFDRFSKSAALAVYQSPKLQECTPASIMSSIFAAAELGLDFTKVKGLAYMVPFWNSKASCMEAMFIPGYRGLIALAYRSGKVVGFDADVVHDVDVLKITKGLNPDLVHIPNYDEEGEIKVKGAYAVAHMRDCKPLFVYMPLRALNKIKASSKSKNKKGENFGPWVDWEDEMMKKTALRQLIKKLPIEVDDLAIAFEHDDKVSGLKDAIDIDIDVPDDVTEDLKNPVADEIEDAVIVDDDAKDAPELDLDDKSNINPRTGEPYKDADQVT